MKKLTFVVMVLSSAVATASETNEQDLVKFGNKMVTREYRRDVIKRVTQARTGGHIRKENTAKGWFVVINAQKAVNPCEIEKALDTLDDQVHIQTKVVSGEGVTVENVKSKVLAAGGALGVAVVDGGPGPALLSAPEEGWSIVNVATLSSDKPDAATLAARVRREVLRGFAFVAGDMAAAYGEVLMQPITKVKDIDAIAYERFAAGLLNTLPLTLPRYGITPWYQTTYRKACEEGWAPAPTNEFQKAVWDKVHAVPQKPMKIEFDPKKGR